MKQTLIVLLAMLALDAQAQMSAEEARRQAEALQKQYAGQVGATQLPEAVSLKESDITNFLGVLPALKEFGIANEVVNANPESVAEIMSLNQKAMDVLDDFGFNPQSFQQVSYSIGLALAGLQTKGRETEIDAVTQQREQMLAQMEGQLTEEQMNMMRNQLNTAMGMVEQMQQQPEGNLALVGKYQDQLMSLLNSM
jgi:uncharacterized protein with von Willebrand factor type A (vWA) domain